MRPLLTEVERESLVRARLRKNGSKSVAGVRPFRPYRSERAMKQY